MKKFKVESTSVSKRITNVKNYNSIYLNGLNLKMVAAMSSASFCLTAAAFSRELNSILKGSTRFSMSA